MYGFPEGFDASFFVGRALEVVSFTANSVGLTFDGRVSITVESSFEYVFGRPDAPRAERQRVPVVSSCVMQLVGHSVEAAEATLDGTLTLRLDGGNVFRCFDDQAGYESYRIAYGDREIFV